MTAASQPAPTAPVPAAPRRAEAPPAGSTDHIIVLGNATWEDYERLMEIRGDHSAPRIAYHAGWLEIMTPSINHETIKSNLGRLVEIWCQERGIRYRVFGSWTIKERREKRGAEPDECYVFGDGLPSAELVAPDLAIEVIWTSGGLDKLEIYRKLDVAEVWIWERGRLTPYVLREDQYVEAASSEVLPGIDLEQLVGFADREYISDAVIEYRAALQA